MRTALVGALIVYVAKTNTQFAMVGLFVIGASMALLNTMTWALEADTVEYGEWKTHIRTEGATYGAFSFTRKCGQAIGASLVGFALGYYGYVSAVDGKAQPQPEEIGPKVADALGVQWEPQAFTSASIEEAEAARIEQPDDGVLSRIFRTLGGSPSVLEDRGGQALFATSDYELVQENNRHVLEATKDGGVILGRNGAVILADRPGAVHVLLTGAVGDRVARAAAAAGISGEQAARRQVREDAIRAEMSQKLYHWDPRDPSRYDLVINTSRLDVPTSVEIIVRASRGTAG